MRVLRPIGIESKMSNSTHWSYGMSDEEVEEALAHASCRFPTREAYERMRDEWIAPSLEEREMWTAMKKGDVNLTTP